MSETKPIKRHKAIVHFSREHHFGLLVSWKIRQGFKKEIPIERIKAYTDWAFENQIKPHFEVEEEYMFPVLADDDKLKKRAIAEHRKLERLFHDDKDVYRALSLIEELLDNHIRFEERILFNHIQELATEEQLEEIEEKHNHTIKEGDWQDEFWK